MINHATKFLVEVVCPVRNGGSAFGETLHSLSRIAGRENFSLLISDNHSTDGCPWKPVLEKLDGWVVEVREKQVISQWASTGTYWFRRGSDYVRLAECRISSMGKESGEYYVGPLYNDLIASGGKVRNFQIKQLYCFGTPKDIKHALGILGNPA